MGCLWVIEGPLLLRTSEQTRVTRTARILAATNRDLMTMPTMASTAAQQRIRRATHDDQLSFDLPTTIGIDLSARADLDANDQQAAFASVAESVERHFTTEVDPWRGSRYEWVRSLPAARRAAAATALVSTWLAHCGHRVAVRGGGREHGLVINDARTTVRLSTVWSGGEFVFQGIAPGSHDLVALLAVEPHRVRLWLVPASEATAHASDNGWITFPAKQPPGWLTGLGGHPLEAARVAAQDVPHPS